MNDETLVSFGSEIKAVEENEDGYKFTGFLVVFDSPDVSNLRDHFTKSTDFDFEDGDARTIYYNHGLDGTFAKTSIGKGKLFIKDAGVWLEGEIKKRTDYLAKHIERVAEGMKMTVATKGIEAPLFGLSSGALSHLVEREKHNDGHVIGKWCIGEASITPTPAEPMTGCVSLKSLMDDGDELKRFNSDQPRDEDGKWSIIRGQSHSITGKKVGESDIHKISDELGLSGHARNALLKVHRDRKITHDGHLLRAIASADDAMSGGHSSSHHAIVAAAAELHGVGGTHENKPWHDGGDAKPTAAHVEKKRAQAPGASTRKSFDDDFFDDEYSDGTKHLTDLEAGQLEGSRFADHTERLHDALSEYVERTRDLMAERASSRKSGRVLSAEKHGTLSDLLAQIRDAADALDALLEAHDPQVNAASTRATDGVVEYDVSKSISPDDALVTLALLQCAA